MNAYSDGSRNVIVFPAAILQAPYFALNADPAINYGAIGGRRCGQAAGGV